MNKLANIKDDKSVKSLYKKEISMKEFDMLKDILLAKERGEFNQYKDWATTEINQLKGNVDNLAIAIRDNFSKNQKNRDIMVNTFQEIVESSIEQSVSKNKKLLAQLLFPIMGNAIVLYLAQFTKGIQESINRRVQALTSMNAIKWYFEAKRKGIDYGKYLEDQTVSFSVNRIHLFDKKSKKFLYSVNRDKFITEVSLDPRLASEEIMWIQNNIIQSKVATLEVSEHNEYSMGDVRVIYSQGVNYIVAYVYRGVCNTELIKCMQNLCDEIDEQPIDVINNDESLEQILEKGLINREPQTRKSSNLKKKVIIYSEIALLLLGISYWSYSSSKWYRLIENLKKSEGIVVVEVKKDWGKKTIYGLKDPLAVEPAKILASSGYSTDKIKLHFDEYLSQNTSFAEVRRKEQNIHEKRLLLTENVTKNSKDQIQSIDSEINNISKRLSDAENGSKKLSFMIPQLKTEIIKELQFNQIAKIKKKNNLGHLINIKVDGSLVIVKGDMIDPVYQKVTDALGNVVGIKNVDISKLVNVTRRDIFIHSKDIEGREIYFKTATNKMLPGEKDKFQDIATLFNNLDKSVKLINKRAKIYIYSTDIKGDNFDANKTLKNKRLKEVRDIFIKYKVNKDSIVLQDKMLSQLENHPARVFFRVKQID